jgi:hypothetical protein
MVFLSYQIAFFYQALPHLLKSCRWHFVLCVDPCEDCDLTGKAHQIHKENEN